MADGKAFQIPQALAAAQDPEHRNKQVPGRDANAPPHAHDRDRLEIADQIAIGCSRNALELREEAIPPTSPMLTAPTRALVTEFESALP